MKTVEIEQDGIKFGFNNKIQNLNNKYNMFTEFELKQSFTLLTEESKVVCSCGNYSKSVLRQRLSKILDCLSEQISAKENQIENMQKCHMSNIKQKQQIIERLAAANSKLVIENQTLSKRVSITKNYLKSTVMAVENKYLQRIKSMKSEIQYLEQRNNQLKNDIIAALASKPQQIYKARPKLSKSPTTTSSGLHLPMHMQNCDGISTLSTRQSQYTSPQKLSQVFQSSKPYQQSLATKLKQQMKIQNRKPPQTFNIVLNSNLLNALNDTHSFVISDEDSPPTLEKRSKSTRSKKNININA